MPNLYSLASYQYELPKEQIAQYPCSPRDKSRLMVVDRSTGNISEMIFRDLVDFLQAGDHLVFNDTRVIPARLLGKRESGGMAEIFLSRCLGDDLWEVLGRPGKKLRPGTIVTFGEGFACKVLEVLADGGRVVRFLYQGNFTELLNQYGEMPLPPYIQRDVDPLFDQERYQTIYAATPGAVAAPTAGLHFTEEMMILLTKKEVYQTKITLHVGLGTFRTVQVEDIRQHAMHTEHLFISPSAAEQLNQRKPTQRQICIGTTTCRALEAVATAEGDIPAGAYESNIFIYPGYHFKYVNSLLTNFHLPGSSLLMLVCALAGYELTMEAYAKAVKDRFRFFSYGDAMLIL